jgi:tetratricopeptide (TPR) repeat protein
MVDSYEALKADRSDKSHATDSLCAIVHFCIGAGYYVLGDWSKASDQLSIYVNMQPRDPFAQFNYAITLVKNYDESGHVAMLEQALETFEQAASLKARFPDALAYWGSALWKMYDVTNDILWLEQADEKLRLAASLDPSSYRIHYLWGGCSATLYSVTGQDKWLRLAYRECCRSVELAAEEANPYLNFACVLAMMGERERMLDALRKSIGFDSVYKKLACETEEFEAYRNDEAFRVLVGK